MAVTISGSDGISGDLPTIKVGNGSESAPAVTGQDTDTGLFFGTNEIKVSTGATAAVTVNSSQRVGIGTTDIDGQLEVRSSGALGIISRSTATQSTSTNKAFKSRNNSDTDTFSVSYTGVVAKASGSFKIDHPLPALAETHHLVHSFVEGPDASNLYAGMVDLVDGTATVNIDTAHRMTEGTFEALNTIQSWSSSNESGYAPVKCSVSGNILTIECQDTTSTDTVYYEVRGIRKDQHMLNTDWTDENGRVITEPLKVTEEMEAAE